MKQNDNKKWLDELLLQKLKKKTNDFDFQQWQEKYPDEIQQLRQVRQIRAKVHTTSWSLIWRTIMKSPYTKFGTIAVGLLIASVFLFPSGEINPNSILLADVEREFLDQHNCMMTGTRILSINEEDPQVTTYTVHKYMSREYGYVDQTFDEDGNLFIQLSVHHPSNVATVLFPQMKRYIKVPVTQKYQEKMKEITPTKLFKLFFLTDSENEQAEDIDIEQLDLRSLECVTQSEIDGIEVVGFSIAALPENISELGFDRLRLFLDMQETRGHIWINPETLLPVQMDAEVDIRKCILTNFREMKLSEVNYFTGWNIEMDEEMFLPEIPGDYELFGIPKVKTTGVIGVSGTAVAVPLLICIKKCRKKKQI